MKYFIIIISFFLCHNIYSQEIQSPRLVKVLTFNIYHGATMNNDYNLDVFADIINQKRPDLVALQEVDRFAKRSKKLDLVTELAVRTGMSPLFGRAMAFDGGEYGVGILSGWSIISSRNIPLPGTAGHEPRTSLEVTVATGAGDTLSFVSTHLDHRGNTDRIMQAEAINSFYGRKPYPTILAGDLNDTPGSEAISILEKLWAGTYDKSHPEATHPSENPEHKIDYVMFRPGSRWKVLDSRVICDTLASDHCAYLVTLELVSK